MFNTHVKSVTLHGCGTQIITKKISNSLQVTVNWCLWHTETLYSQLILQMRNYGKEKTNVYWKKIKERKWCWTGHTLRNRQGAIERHALDWNPKGTKKRVSKEKLEKNKRMGTAEDWRKAKALVLDRTKWKGFKALCSTQKEQKEWMMMKPHRKLKCTVKYRLTEYFFFCSQPKPSIYKLLYPHTL